MNHRLFVEKKTQSFDFKTFTENLIHFNEGNKKTKLATSHFSNEGYLYVSINKDKSLDTFLFSRLSAVN